LAVLAWGRTPVTLKYVLVPSPRKPQLSSFVAKASAISSKTSSATAIAASSSSSEEIAVKVHHFLAVRPTRPSETSLAVIAVPSPGQ
jgi:hypothetical protein